MRNIPNNVAREDFVGVTNDAERIGGRLHGLRSERGLTLARLAEMAGLTRGYLSLLERDLKAPSLAALVRIADALGTEVGSLFAEAPTGKADYVVYRHHGPVNESAESSYRALPLIPTRFGKVMEPFFISPSLKPMKRVTHSGDELIVVIHGSILVKLGSEKLTLGLHDSVYFTAATEHQLTSLGDVRALVLIVVSRDARKNPQAKEVEQMTPAIGRNKRRSIGRADL